MGRILVLLLIVVLLNPLKAASQPAFRPPPDSVQKTWTNRPMPQKFYTQPLGFFCKKEVQLQKQLKLPVYFRLGTKEYVDRLEGKASCVRRD